MSELPLWIQEWSEKSHCDECDTPNSERQRRILETIQIAWQALHAISLGGFSTRYADVVVKKAMERIEELGK
jgi:hypothetical protein